ncbi:MAG: hypothetical protein HXS54_13365 [Theionarchaea archaeon]|nr:hypothetical protein [Theionarchaea archaeon]
MFSKEREDEILKVISEILKKEGLGLEDIPPETFNSVFSKAAVPLLEDLKNRIPDMLKEHHRYKTSFEKRLYKLWKEPLNLLEMFLVISHEAGETFNKEFRPEAVKNQDFVFEVLVRLHARACLTGNEIVTLLCSGYASGAHARWRTLHEIAVTGFFVKEYGNDVAERYLLHDSIESYKAMMEYQKHSNTLGYPLLIREEKKLKKFRDKLRSKYGKSFVRETYGWAADALKKEKPRFSDIESAVNLSHLRPFYRMAAHAIHANPKGITFDLGSPGINKELLLTGPSNTGLADPGQLTAISLNHINVALLGTRTSLNNQRILLMMNLLVEETKNKFLEVHKLTESMMKN